MAHNHDHCPRPTSAGKKIKNIVREAEGQVKAALTVSPGDPLMLENRKEVYLLLRKLAELEHGR